MSSADVRIKVSTESMIDQLEADRRSLAFWQGVLAVRKITNGVLTPDMLQQIRELRYADE